MKEYMGNMKGYVGNMKGGISVRFLHMSSKFSQ